MLSPLAVVVSCAALMHVDALLDGSLSPASNSELLTLIRQMNQTFHQMNRSYEAEITSLKQEIQLLKQFNNKSVAFSSTLFNRVDGLGKGQVIKYDRVLTNIGAGYDSRTGYFTAKETGAYHFSITAMGKSGAVLNLNLMKNGQVMEEIHSDGNNLNGYAEGSENIILHLTIGDMVWVTFHYGEPYIEGFNHNSFSGFLIK